MAEWQNGRMAEWQNGRMIEWQTGIMGEWQNGRMGEWQLAEWQNGNWQSGFLPICHGEMAKQYKGAPSSARWAVRATDRCPVMRVPRGRLAKDSYRVLNHSDSTCNIQHLDFTFASIHIQITSDHIRSHQIRYTRDQGRGHL